MKTILAAAAPVGGVTLAATALPAQVKTIKIGLSMLTQNAPYSAALQAAVQKEAKSPGATVVTADANNDMLKQISDVEDMLSQNIDVLVMDPKDARGLVGVTKQAVYVVPGVLSALGGIIITARSGVGSPVVGIGMEPDVIAAVVIGGASLMGGRGAALNTLIGVLTLGVIGNIMNLLNVPGYHQEVVKGVIILVAVLLQSSFWPRRG